MKCAVLSWRSSGGVFGALRKNCARCCCTVRVLVILHQRRTRLSVVSGQCARVPLGRARLLPSRSQLPLFSCRCLPTTVARAFLTRGTKCRSLGFSPGTNFSSPLKSPVFFMDGAEQECSGYILSSASYLPGRPYAHTISRRRERLPVAQPFRGLITSRGKDDPRQRPQTTARWS